MERKLELEDIAGNIPYDLHVITDRTEESQLVYCARYDKYKCISNQYRLFDYLNELKIDYRSLIDAGLAIDVNTLKNNPYK